MSFLESAGGSSVISARPARVLRMVWNFHKNTELIFWSKGRADLSYERGTPVRGSADQTLHRSHVPVLDFPVRAGRREHVALLMVRPEPDAATPLFHYRGTSLMRPSPP